MHKLTIGFLGGCIHAQSNIGRENAYYSILSKLASGAEKKFELQISLGQYFSYDQLIQRAENFINKKSPICFFSSYGLSPLCHCKNRSSNTTKPTAKRAGHYVLVYSHEKQNGIKNLPGINAQNLFS